ncbi:MAG: sulfatase family protein [Candidatus Binatia bacterium]
MMKTLRLLSLAVVVLAAEISSGPSTSIAQSRRPNIIFILADDLNVETMAHLPRLQSLLAARGTTFANYFVSLALCCPSRASILRGQYAHNTEIFTNMPPGGGFQKFLDLGREESTVATWLHDGGYRTVLLGKYLNGYPVTTHVPPGWDEWYAVAGAVNFFNYRLNENGEIVTYGNQPEDYLTDVLSQKASDFIVRTAPMGQPFFMYVAPYAPHQPADPAPRHEEEFPGVQAPRTASFNEADVSDKPTWVQNTPPRTPAQITQLDALYRRRLQSMLAVEDLLEQLIRTLRRTHQLSNTYIVFTSDNGFHLGQHRLPAGKNTAYEEDIRVPLIVRGPGVPAGRVIEHLAVNIDFAPTFAELAGAQAADFVDGRSLVPLLTSDPPAVEGWRQAFLLEAGFITGNRVFQGIRTNKHTYVEYLNTGERELYDLEEDPDQLQSLHDTADPEILEQLASWLATLRACAGASCRSAEDTPP